MKINAKQIKYLNIRDITIKLLKETGGKFHDIEFVNNFLDITPKVQATKEKIDKLDFIKIENFFASNNINNRMKRQSIEWEKIFAVHKSKKELLFRIYKELNLTRNTNKSISKLAKDLHRFLFK